MMNRTLAIALIGAMITNMGITCSIVIRQDSTVLLSLSSTSGGLVRYITGRKKKATAVPSSWRSHSL